MVYLKRSIKTNYVNRKEFPHLSARHLSCIDIDALVRDFDDACVEFNARYKNASEAEKAQSRLENLLGGYENLLETNPNQAYRLVGGMALSKNVDTRIYAAHLTSDLIINHPEKGLEVESTLLRDKVPAVRRLAFQGLMLYCKLEAPSPFGRAASLISDYLRCWHSNAFPS